MEFEFRAGDVGGLKQSRRNGFGKIKRFQKYLKDGNKRKHNRDEGVKRVKDGDQVSSQVDSGIPQKDREQRRSRLGR